MGANGTHLVADFWGCRLPRTEADWRRLLSAAVQAMDATLLQLDVHQFEPQGATAVAILSESHVAVHTWPERDYVAIDVFTCGATVSPDSGIAFLRGELRPQRERILEISRGETPLTAEESELPECASRELRTTPVVGEPECRST